MHLDCAALPKDLIEAELFGHEKGAFTDAHTARTGLRGGGRGRHRLPGRDRGAATGSPVAAARGCSSVREVRRIGSTRPRPRGGVVHRPRPTGTWTRWWTTGAFRADLYYRLKVLSLDIPPPARAPRRPGAAVRALRGADRQGATACPAPEFSPEILETARRYDWPGNVRGARAHGRARDPARCGPRAGCAGPSASSPPRPHLPIPGIPWPDSRWREAERRLVVNALQDTGGNVSESARAARSDPDGPFATAFGSSGSTPVTHGRARRLERRRSLHSSRNSRAEVSESGFPA